MSDTMTTEAAAGTDAATEPAGSYADYKGSLGGDEAAGDYTAHRDALEGDSTAPPAEAAAASDDTPPAAPEGDQPRGPDGKFVAKEPAAAEATADAEQEPAPTGEQTPAGFVRIELAQDHPLRAQGHDHVLAPAGQEDLYRALANQPVRRAEVEAARQREAALQQDLARTQAQARAQAEFNALLFDRPEVIDTYRNIAQEHGDDAAQTWLNGLLSQHGEAAQGYVEQALQQQQEAAYQRQATEFVQTVQEQAGDRYGHLPEAERAEFLSTTLAAFGAWAEARGQSDLSLDDYYRYADAFYIQHPAVQQAVQGWSAEQERAATAAREKQEQDAAAARAQQAREQRTREENPLGTIPAAAHTGHRVPGATEEQAPTDYYAYKASLVG